MVVHKRLSRVHTGRETEQARPVTGLGGFVEQAGQNLLSNARGIAGRGFPPALHVDSPELVMQFWILRRQPPLSLYLVRNILLKCGDVLPHRALGSIRIPAPQRIDNGAVLAQHKAVMVTVA